MTKKIKLWGSGTARTLRPIWIAEELGLDYDLVSFGPRTGETLTEEFTELNPKQKIPLLQHGSFFLTESLAICRYLQNTFPSNNLYIPEKLSDIAKEDEWSSFIYGEIDETALYVMRRHYDLKEIYGDSPVVVEACREYLLRQFKVLENHLSNNKTILNGGFGLVDIFLITCLDWAIFYEFKLTENLSLYRESIIKREAYKKAMKINYSK
tara:strand:- start:1939 stop:2568 length:630 start_codon:yes stop_codon:yes gene_type:complete